MKMTTFFSILQTYGSGAWCNNNNWEKPMASLKRIGVLFQTLKKGKSSEKPRVPRVPYHLYGFICWLVV